MLHVKCRIELSHFTRHLHRSRQTMEHSPSADQIIISISINNINIVIMIIETTFGYSIQPKTKNQASNPASKIPLPEPHSFLVSSRLQPHHFPTPFSQNRQPFRFYHAWQLPLRFSNLKNSHVTRPRHTSLVTRHTSHQERSAALVYFHRLRAQICKVDGLGTCTLSQTHPHAHTCTQTHSPAKSLGLHLLSTQVL